MQRSFITLSLYIYYYFNLFFFHSWVRKQHRLIQSSFQIFFFVLVWVFHFCDISQLRFYHVFSSCLVDVCIYFGNSQCVAFAGTSSNKCVVHLVPHSITQSMAQQNSVPINTHWHLKPFLPGKQHH